MNTVAALLVYCSRDKDSEKRGINQGMGFGQSHAERYDTGEKISSGKHFEVRHAKETSTGSPCVMYVVDLPENASDSDRQLATSILKGFAALHIPRSPRLIDAWLTDEKVFAIEVRWEAPPISKSNNPFRGATRFQKAAVYDRSLMFLAHLHKSNIVLEHVTTEIFGYDHRGKLFMLNHGLENALIRALHTSRDQFNLAGNMMAKDLADWAFDFLSLHMGAPIHETPEGEHWDSIDFRDTDSHLSEEFIREDLRSFFLDCLAGYAVGEPRFENAQEAWEFWTQKKLTESFR